MYNIKFKGIFREESQLKKNDKQVNAIQFDEPNNLNGFIAKACLCSLALVIFTLYLVVTEIYKLLVSFDIKKIEIIQSLVISGIIVMVGQFVHEIIHALFFSREAEKEIYISKDLTSLLIYCTETVSKVRFIIISLAPNVILGMIPLFIGIFCTEIPIIQIRMVLLITGGILTIVGIGDYYNVYNALYQVPCNGLIFSNGMHSYWYRKDGIETIRKKSNKPFLILLYSLGSILLYLDLKVYLILFFLIILTTTFNKGIFYQIVKWCCMIVIFVENIDKLGLI